MKNTKLRWIVLVLTVALAFVLGGCAFDTTGESSGTASAGPAGSSASSQSASSAPSASEAPPSTSQPYFISTFTELVCRVVHRDGDVLLLAQHQGTASDVYLLDVSALPDEDGSIAEIEPGELIYVTCSGEQTDSFPAHLGGVQLVSRARGGFDDLCVLYLQVLEDLWAVDSGLNEGITMLSVMLTETSLCPSEQSAVAWQFAQNHDLQQVQGGYDQLVEQGYLTPDDPTNPNTLYHWEDGCLFTITEQPLEGVYHGLRPLKFEAMKWRSGLGAYLFTDCTSVQSAMGQWAEYTVGGHAIS